MLVPLLEAIFRTAPAADWLARLERAGVPAGKIKSVGEALESEHLRARGAIVTVNHPTAGRMRMVGPPIRLHGTPAEAATPAPLLGEHTDEVLTKLLGILVRDDRGAPRGRGRLVRTRRPRTSRARGRPAPQSRGPWSAAVRV